MNHNCSNSMHSNLNNMNSNMNDMWAYQPVSNGMNNAPQMIRDANMRAEVVHDVRTNYNNVSRAMSVANNPNMVMAPNQMSTNSMN